MGNRWGNNGNSDSLFLSSNFTADDGCSHEIKRYLLRGRKAMTNLDNILKSRDIALLTKVHLVKAMVFQVVVYGCEVGPQRRLSAKELMLLNCDVGEDLESPLDCKEIQPVHSEGEQPWDFFGRNDAKAEATKLWPADANSSLIRKDPDAGKD